MKKAGYLTLALIILSPLTLSASLGVTPGYIGFDEFERGSTQEIEFYVTTTNIDSEFQINPKYSKTLNYALGNRSSVPMEEVSEQDVSEWITFTEDSYAVDPTTSQTYQLPNGASVNAEARVTMRISVPSDAEPGYRMGKLHLNPDISTEGGGSGAGARVIAQTVGGFSFRVPGRAIRNIENSGVRAVRIGENQVQIIMQLRNTGTTTTMVTGGEVDILNDNGQKAGSVSVDSALLKPGEYAEVDSIWAKKNMEPGEYRLDGVGDYRTGKTYISGDFVVRDVIRQRASIDRPDAQQVKETSTPWLLIGIAAVLLAVFLYLMDISMFWNAVITGSAALVLYIVLGPMSIYLVLIPLVFMVVLWYI